METNDGRLKMNETGGRVSHLFQIVSILTALYKGINYIKDNQTLPMHLYGFSQHASQTIMSNYYVE